MCGGIEFVREMIIVSWAMVHRFGRWGWAKDLICGFYTIEKQLTFECSKCKWVLGLLQLCVSFAPLYPLMKMCFLNHIRKIG